MKRIYYKKMYTSFSFLYPRLFSRRINKYMVIIVSLLLLLPISCQSPSKNKKSKESVKTMNNPPANIPKANKEMVVIEPKKDKKPILEPVETDKDGVYAITEVMPEFPGGQGALGDYLKKEANANYPQKAKQDTIQGRVILQFIIEKDGSITNPVIVRTVHSLLDSVAMKIVRKMPKWIPGTHNKKPVRVKYTIPVMFKFTEVPYTGIIESIED